MPYTEKDPGPGPGQPFPPGAVTHAGHCAGAFCQGRPATVADCRAGPTFRQAMALSLCADCVADFALAATAIPEDVKVIQVDFPGGQAVATDVPPVHIYVKAEDGLYHEVRGELDD